MFKFDVINYPTYFTFKVASSTLYHFQLIINRKTHYLFVHYERSYYSFLSVFSPNTHTCNHS